MSAATGRVPGRRAPVPGVRAAALAFAALGLGAAAVHAAAPAGTRILNQASATYLDATGVERTATSNVVETVVRQSAGVLLTQSQNRLVAAGATTAFPHTVTNTGNGPDAFALDATNAVADDFDLGSVAIFADADQNGVADDATALSTSPTLAPDAAFHFVVVGTVPGGALGGSAGELRVRAVSGFNAGIEAANLDRATVGTGAVVDVFKSMSALGGPSPGGPHTVTLDYRNASGADATDLVLIDALPPGMSYVPGSARWSVTGALALTDANAADVQGGAPDTIRFCAYDASCTGLPESDRDADATSANQVTAVIANVAAGARGSLAFQVTIDAGLDAGTLPNAAEHEYGDGAATVGRATTNTVAFEVSGAAGVVANGSATSAVDGEDEPLSLASAPQGATVSFANVVWNVGNETDTLDVSVDGANATFPPDTVFRLFREDGATPLLDSDGDGIPDTGPLAPGVPFPLVMKAILPPAAIGDNAGAGFAASVVARSTNDPAASNPVVNRLEAIAPGTVDLTNDAAAGDTDALGEGIGPEADAVKTVVAAPGTVARFALHVANVGTAQDAFSLSASTDETFDEIGLPPGWSVEFRSADDTETVTGSGPVAPAESVLVYADVRVPADAASGPTSLYFRALSATTGTVDVIHDAVDVADTAALLLEPDGAGQVEPGGSIVYAHRVQNTGNATLAGIALGTADSLAGAGWQSSVHEDANGDGTLDPDDPVVDAIAALAPGESRVLFVKAFAPPTAPAGASNVTTLVATWDSGAESVSVDDVTTVASGDIGIVKEQAPDLGCDGSLDGAYTRQPFSVEPGGNCVSYRLTATNAGVEPVFNAVIEDATPPFTVYRAPASCSAPGCVVVEPADGATGRVAGEVARVDAGERVEFTFAVAVE